MARNIDEFGQEQKNAHAETLKALATIGNNIQKLLTLTEKEFQSHSEFKTILNAPSTVPFSADGYKFNSVVVSDAAAADAVKLVVNVFGGSYTKTLQAGENVVNIPDGAQISVTSTSGNNYTMLLQRFNFLKQ